MDSENKEKTGDISQDSFDKTVDERFDSKKLKSLEENATGGIEKASDALGSESLNKGSRSADAATEQSFYRNSSGNKARSRKGPLSRKKIALGTTVVGIIISGFFAILTFIPLQIAHIKEVFRGAYGGTQEASLGSRRMRIYNRAYFFRNDGEFDGYKQRGMFGFLKNRSSNKLIDDLNSRGFKVTPELSGGKWTGKFLDIEYKGQKITGANSSVWERRSAVRTMLTEEYPTRGFMWRSRAAKKVYARYGLNRSNWWTDNAATRKIDNLEARFRSKVRDALKRKAPADLGVDAPKSGQDGESGDTDADRANADEASKAKSDLDTKTSASLDPDLNSPDPPNPIDEVPKIDPADAAEAAAKAGAKSVLGALKITGAVEAACTGLQTMNQIEAGSRTIKRLQLIKGFTVYMSLIDAVRTGDVDSKDVGMFMSLMTAKDPKTGKNAYQSGGWLWASKGGGKEPHYGNTYNTGGGATGALRDFRTTAYTFTGGPNNVEGTCGTVTNGLFQIGSGILGIGAAIFSGGTFTAGNIAANFTIGIAVEMIRTFATPLITNLAAGTMVNGWEKGERLGDMLGAASGSAYYVQGSQLGLRPLKKPEKVALMKEYNDMVKDQFNQKPLYAKIFDLSDTKSIVSKIAINSPKSPEEFVAFLGSPLRMFNFSKAYAEENYECNDEDIVTNNIATDPFCNPILGEPDLGEIDPIDNMKWMVDNKYVDDNGNPLGEYSDYVKECFENENIETLFDINNFTTSFNSKCMDRGDNNKLLRFRAFQVDFGLVQCIDRELDTGSCSE